MSSVDFKIGDKVKIVHWGHLIYVPLDGVLTLTDIHRGIIGREGVISEIEIIQGSFKYKLSGIPEKTAWYDEEQLEKVLPAQEA